MAIVSIISLVAISAFTQITRLNQVATDDKEQAAQVEADIANPAAEPTRTEKLPAIKLGGFTLPSEAATYENGRRSYTVLQDGGPQGQNIYVGDGASVYEGKGLVVDTGNAGGAPDAPYTIVASGRYLLEVWGARGGGIDKSADRGSDYAGGGKGGYAAGIAKLSAGDSLFLHAGGRGGEYQTTGEKIGGFNGGGNVMTNTEGGTTGGGASDICINTDSLYARVVVAGGGGGGGYTRVPTTYNKTPGVITGGAGGGTAGLQGAMCSDSWKNYRRGRGGTQFQGGALGGTTGDSSYSYPAKPGTFGNGGRGTGQSAGGAGGGGGWYGGGGGCINSAGGGSGWTYTATALNSWKSGNPTDAAGWLLDSIYYLENTSLIDGAHAMPDPLDAGYQADPSTGLVTGARPQIYGNNGGGFIRITWLGFA
jgi:hypothetical protein